MSEERIQPPKSHEVVIETQYESDTDRDDDVEVTYNITVIINLHRVARPREVLLLMKILLPNGHPK